MANSKAYSWSNETYRLDELERQVELPKLIQVTEGVDTGNDVDSFSAEDVLMIDQSVTLLKVAAQFAERVTEWADTGSQYEVLTQEILLPLNYKGKLKVIYPIKKYDGVRLLARAFPRYAIVLENMRVSTESGGFMDIKSGTKVEVDRIIPGHKNNCDRLVLNTALGGRRQVAIPFDQNGRFRSCPDDNEYTLQEVVDRYSLPRVIRFLDNKIRTIYTQDLIEGIELMTNVTESALQINRVIVQNVLIGHYPEPDETKDPSGKYCKRTLVVIPLNSIDTREIIVRIRESDMENDPIYEPFLVKNVNADNSDYVDISEGLYVEFCKRPRIIRLKEGELKEADNDEYEDVPPPPVPPRPGQPGHGAPPPIPRKPRPKPKPKPKPAPTQAQTLENVPKTGNDEHMNRTKAKANKNPTPNEQTESKPKKDDNVDGTKTKANQRPTPAERVGKQPTKEVDYYYAGFNTKPKPNSTPVDDDPEGLGDYEVPDNPPISPKASQHGPTSPSFEQHSPKSKSLPAFQTSASGTLSFNIADIPFDTENVKKHKSKDKKVLSKVTGFLKGKKVHAETTDKSKQDDIEHVVEDPREIEGDTYDEIQELSYDNSMHNDKEKHNKTPLQGKKQPVTGNIETVSKVTGFSKGKKVHAETTDKSKQDDIEHVVEDPGEIEGDAYEEIQELSYDNSMHNDKEKHNKTPLQGKKQPVTGNIETVGSKETRGANKRPMAKVAPQTHGERAKPKEFRFLNREELEERLILCGMTEFAKFCVQENLDGPFLHEMDSEMMKSLGLSRFSEKKLKRIIAGWTPSP